MTAKRCLVIGGTGNIGAEVCRCLAREGAEVAFTWSANRARAEALSAELGGAPSFRCNLREWEATREVVREAARALGGLDSLVQCCGIAKWEPFDRVGDADFEEIVQTNVHGTFSACQAAAPLLAAAPGGGNIVLLGALAGLKLVPAPVHFAASKGAVKALAETLAKLLGPSGVKVNCVAPGLVEGESLARLGEKERGAYLRHCALGRFAAPREIAEVVAWLCLENSYVTGQSLILDGGL